MNIEKNQEYIVEIIDNGYEGEGIAKIDGFTIFIPGAIKGEKIRILIVKVLSSHAFGKVLEILEPSKSRKDPDCLTYKRCGGCNLRHIKYDETLEMKQNAVQSLVNKTLTNKIEVQKTIGMENPIHYRNKAQYPVGINKNGEPIIGVFAERTHEVIPMEKCMIQNPKSEEIAKFIIELIKEKNISVYNEKTGKGLFRHIVIKIGIKTNEIMCILVINGKEIPYENELLERIKQKFPEIKSIIKNINLKNTNVILGKENIDLYGNGYIEDILGEYKFKISPLSFYQVNPIQMKKLYDTAIDFAKLTGNEVVYDLYSGIGTISLSVAKNVKKVYGIEIVKDAVIDARANARMNNITNTSFMDGKVEELLPKLCSKEKADVIFVDPPRSGLDGKTIKTILKVKPKKLVYISCNPDTLVDNLFLLEKDYDIKVVQPVDMFPFTGHVECVTVLDRKNIEK